MRALPLLLLLGLVAAACGDSFTPGQDDDDSALPADPCEAAEGPLELTFTGGMAGTIVFDPPDCSVAGGTWTAVWEGEGAWVLTLEATGVVEGELLTEGINLRLEDGAGAIYASEGGLNTLDVQRYEPPGPPCGLWTVNALDDGAGGFVTVSPQPVPLRCD